MNKKYFINMGNIMFLQIYNIDCIFHYENWKKILKKSLFDKKIKNNLFSITIIFKLTLIENKIISKNY